MPNELTLSQIERSTKFGKKRYDKMYPWEEETLEEFKKAFRSHFIQSPEILYILRAPHYTFGAHLVIGFAEADLTVEQLKTAENIAHEIVGRKEGKNCLTIECKEIPEDGEFLLFHTEQAHTIAKNLKNPDYSEFERLELVYLEILRLQKDGDSNSRRRCFQILTEFAVRCVESGHQRKGIASAEHAAQRLRSILACTDPRLINREDFVEDRVSDIGTLNHIFSMLEIPENGVRWASVYLSLLEKRFGPLDEIWRWSLCLEIENMSDHAEEIQGELTELKGAVESTMIYNV